MKSKKALKRLSEAEQILGDVRHKYVGTTAEIDDVLEAATESLAKARNLVETSNGDAGKGTADGSEVSTSNGRRRSRRAETTSGRRGRRKTA